MKKLAVVADDSMQNLAGYGFEMVSAEEAFRVMEKEREVRLVFELPRKEGVVTTAINRSYVVLFAFLEGGWKQGWLLPSTVLVICHPVNFKEVTRLAVTNEVTFDVLCELLHLDSVMRGFIGSDTVCLRKRQTAIRSA
jgi:hypothetical protein